MLATDYRRDLDVADIAELLEFAEELADHARRMVDEFVFEARHTKYKAGEVGPVTALDRQIEKTCKSLISNRFPGHSIVGEETEPVRGHDNFVWLLDPIDGTEFLFAASYGVLYRGRIGDVGGNRQDAVVTVSGFFQSVDVYVESSDQLALCSEIARRESAHSTSATGDQCDLA